MKIKNRSNLFKSLVILSACLSFSQLSRAQVNTSNSLGQPYETEARRTLSVLLNQSDDLSILHQIYQAHIKLQKKRISNEKNFLKECDVFSSSCNPGNILLFRGQPTVSTPGVSGLVRSHWSNMSYGENMNLPQLIEKLAQDINFFKTEISAPGAESSFSADKVILSFDHSKQLPIWSSEYKKKRTPYAYQYYRDNKETPYLNTKQILFTFHVNYNYFYFEDPFLQKDMLLDPLISFSSDLNQAMVFAVGSLQSKSKHHIGDLIVISVPENKLTDLCNSKINPGDVWKTKDCSEYLNEHEDEDEYDVLGYIKPEHIFKIFRVNWNEFSIEMNTH
jgi:hypothetical protein